MFGILDRLPANDYKTYIVILLIALVQGFAQMGYFDQGSANDLTKWLAILGGVTLNHAVHKKATE